MRVAEMLQKFRGMPACDRIHLLCQMLLFCPLDELHFVLTVLLGFKEENSEKWSKQELAANQPSYFSGLGDGGILAGENLAKLRHGTMLLRPDNRAAAQELCKILDDKDLMASAKSCDNLELLNDLRLLYVVAAYQPALPYCHKQELLATLDKLDSLFEQKEAEASAGPSDDAYISSCEVKGVYKRSSDKRLPYVIKVTWSDGTISYIQRTYGDFFSFQNKLLDLYPEESGQRNKRQRVIPFLPGRKLFSGRSNRELAEKRLPELYHYTRDLVALPEYVSHSKHVLDFFRPWDSDVKYDAIPWHKLKTLQDVRQKQHVRAIRPLSPSQSGSQSGIGRVSHTLPLQTNQKSEPKEGESPLARRFTYPARPSGGASAFTRVVTSNAVHGKMSSSQNSLSSGERQPGALATTTTTTTAACRVVTPPTKRTNGSPAFSMSGVANNRVVWSASRRSSEASESPDVIANAKQGKPVDVSSQSSNSFVSLDSPVHHGSKTSAGMVGTPAKKKEAEARSRNWADRCSPPPESSTDAYPSSFIPISTSLTSTGVAESKLAGTAAVTRTTAASTPTTLTTAPSSSRTAAPPATMTTGPSPSPTGYIAPPPRGIPFSPSLPQLYTSIHTPYSLGSYPLGSSPLGSPIPSPKRHPPMRTSHTPTSTITISESELFGRWLKSHRLHKYSYLLQNMNFEEVCKLTVEQLKGLGMTLGAAKKLYQKLEELRSYGATSFRDIPFVNISRKPSTSSLPAALVLEPKLTPSSSIDQLSLHSSTCSLDVIGQAHSHTPVSAGLSGDNSAVKDMDNSTLEPGCSLDYNSEDEQRDMGTLKYGIRASNSHSSMSSAQSSMAESRGKLNSGLQSRCSLESTSPRGSSLSEDPALGDRGPLSAGGPHRERVSSMPEKRCASLSPTQRLFSTPQPSSHAADVHHQLHPHPINALWEVQLQLQQQQQQVAVVMANLQQQHGLGYPGTAAMAAPGWSAQQAVIGPSPALTNSFGPPHTHSPYPHGNGMMRIPLVDPIHLSMTCPGLAPQNPVNTSMNRTNPRHMVTCCNCAGKGHRATACPFNTAHSLKDHTISGTNSYRETVK